MGRTDTLRDQAELPTWIEPLAHQLALKLREDMVRQTAATERLTEEIRQLAEVQLTVAETLQRRLQQLRS